jgi:hypothetical protein
MPGGQPPAGAAPNPHDLPTPPLEVAPAPAPTTPVQTSMVAAGGDQCPSCQATMAADQRYCLECGHRRGDPRLPFMDAVVFMEAARQPSGAAAAPPPPRERKPRMSANASLIAGIATLILAIGVGVLIGRSGNSGTTSAANAAPQIIKVGGGTETESSNPAESTGNAKKGKKGSGKSKKANAKAEAGSSGTSKGVEEVIKPEAGVKIAPPKTQVGGKCEKGTAGCSGEEFTGEFFGE